MLCFNEDTRARDFELDTDVVLPERTEPRRAVIPVVAVMIGGMSRVFGVFIRALVRGKSAISPRKRKINAGFDERA
jgi:hypothetical protein